MTVEAGGQNLIYALSRHTRSVLQDNWAVQTVVNSIQFTVRLANPSAAVPNVSPSDAANYAGARIEFYTGVLGGLIGPSGSPFGRWSSVVQSVATSLQSGYPVTMVTLADPMPALPDPGDRFVILYPQPRIALEQENAYRIVTIDLTVQRIGALLGVSGTSITVIDQGGASWSMQLIQGNGTLGDPIASSYLTRGTELDMSFGDIAITNNAAPTGTPPAVLFVGRRV